MNCNAAAIHAELARSMSMQRFTLMVALKRLSWVQTWGHSVRLHDHPIHANLTPAYRDRPGEIITVHEKRQAPAILRF